MGDRVAVIVVAGVGDDAAGSSTERIAEGLTGSGWTAGEEVREWFPSPDEGSREGDPGSLQSVRRITMRRAAGQPTEVDVFEFWWADLSRFPAALRSFIAAFLGLFIDLPGAGRAALLGARAFGPTATEPSSGPMPDESQAAWKVRRLAAQTLSLLGWLIAVPIVIVTMVVLAVSGFYILALYLHSADASDRQTAIAVIVVGFFAALGSAKAILTYRKSGRALIVTSAVGLLGAAVVVGLVLALGQGRTALVALGDTLVVVVAYPFRVLWLAVLALAFLLVALLLVRTALGWGQKASRGRWWRSSVTGLTATALGPFGIALLLGALVGAVGVAAKPLLDRASLTQEEMSWCLADPQDWVPSSAGCAAAKVGGGGETGTAWDWGSTLFGQSLAPLIFATVALLVVGVLMVAWVLWLWLDARAERGADDSTGTRGARRASIVYVAVERTLGPLLVILIPAAAWVGAAQWLAWLPPHGIPRLGAPGTEKLTVLVALLGVAVASMLVLAKALGISPSGAATGGKANERVRSMLDRPYDVATYLREPPRIPDWVSAIPTFGALDSLMPSMPRARMPRERMVARYKAMLDHLHHYEERGAPAPYDRLLILAHSQGTVLTVTMLHDPPATLPPVVRLITFGSPLRQLYLQRLPRQFGWLDELATNPYAYLSESSNLVEWVSLATPKDYVGRTVHVPVPDPWPDGVDVRRRIGTAADPGRPDLALGELTLPEGRHGTYWRSRTLFGEVERMIEGGEPSEPPSPWPAPDPGTSGG